MTTLVAPFPYFGGKRRVAAEVWRRFGDVRSYVEPFFGSGAVLLARPTPFAGVETVNDLDGLLCNAWRAIQADPAAVARHADWPVSECDLTARHLWLVGQRDKITERLLVDPAWHDARAAGWWIWGASAWIGSGWCSGDGPWREVDGVLSKVGAGEELPGVARQLPHIDGNHDSGHGIHRKMPHLGGGHGGAGKGITTAAMRDRLEGIFQAMSDRLRLVRLACGDWSRVLGDSVTWRHGLCGVFLDPPYETGGMDYAVGGVASGLASDVRTWAVEAGRHPLMRIALCGYDEHDQLAEAGWTPHRWKNRGGYGNQGGDDADDNRHREVVWFSPNCLGARQPGLFD